MDYYKPLHRNQGTCCTCWSVQILKTARFPDVCIHTHVSEVQRWRGAQAKRNRCQTKTACCFTQMPKLRLYSRHSLPQPCWASSDDQANTDYEALPAALRSDESRSRFKLKTITYSKVGTALEYNLTAFQSGVNPDYRRSSLDDPKL